MELRMEADEGAMFKGFLRSARSYVEFGSGGSTVAAAALVQGPVTTLDSSQEWLSRVEAACTAMPAAARPKLVFADIGPIGAWGTPVGESHRERWPDYAKCIWSVEGASQADLFLVDGRFRVSCAVETLLRCRADAILLIHDFAHRTRYHVVRELAREVATTRTLTAFIKRADFNAERARQIAQEHLFIAE